MVLKQSMEIALSFIFIAFKHPRVINNNVEYNTHVEDSRDDLVEAMVYIRIGNTYC